MTIASRMAAFAGATLVTALHALRELRIGSEFAELREVVAEQALTLVHAAEAVAVAEDRAAKAEADYASHECEDIAGGAMDAQAEAERALFAMRADRDLLRAEVARQCERANGAELEVERLTATNDGLRCEVRETRGAAGELAAEVERLERHVAPYPPPLPCPGCDDAEGADCTSCPVPTPGAVTEHIREDEEPIRSRSECRFRREPLDNACSSDRCTHPTRPNQATTFAACKFDMVGGHGLPTDCPIRTERKERFLEKAERVGELPSSLLAASSLTPMDEGEHLAEGCDCHECAPDAWDGPGVRINAGET